jgi:hypothetical protein
MNRLRRVLARAQEVVAQVSQTKVIDAFYNDFATEASGRYWWWCQMFLLDPFELIVNDGYDNLWRVPFTINGEDVVFGEAVQVKIEYVDVAARADQVAAACAGIATVRGETKIAARYSTRAETCPDRKEGGNMKELMAKLRARLNLPEGTPDEEVLRVAAEAGPGDSEGVPDPDTEGVPQPEGQPGGGSEDDDEGGGDVESDAGASASAAGTVTVDAAALVQLQADARMGREARTEQLQSQDEQLLMGAVEVGKFAPSRKAHFAALLEADREGTIELIKSLAENVIPVKLRGETPNAESSNVVDISGWFPEIAARKAAEAAAGGPSRVTMAGGD